VRDEPTMVSDAVRPDVSGAACPMPHQPLLQHNSTSKAGRGGE
jgi:hypothetical protein